MQSWLEGRNCIGKCAQATGMTASLRILPSKADSGFDLGCYVICWCWSTVFSEVHSQRRHLPGNFRALPSADKLYGDADLIFQLDLAPAHTAKATKSWFNGHGVTVLDWPANSPELNPKENLCGIVKRKTRDTRPNNADDLKAVIKTTWSSLHLSSATGWLPRCHAALMQ